MRRPKGAEMCVYTKAVSEFRLAGHFSSSSRRKTVSKASPLARRRLCCRPVNQTQFPLGSLPNGHPETSSSSLNSLTSPKPSSAPALSCFKRYYWPNCFPPRVIFLVSPSSCGCSGSLSQWSFPASDTVPASVATYSVRRVSARRS